MKNEMLARIWRHMSKNKYTEKELFKDHSGRDNIWALKKSWPEKYRESESEHSRLRKSSVKKCRAGMGVACSGDWEEVMFILD